MGCLYWTAAAVAAAAAAAVLVLLLLFAEDYIFVVLPYPLYVKAANETFLKCCACIAPEEVGTASPSDAFAAAVAAAAAAAAATAAAAASAAAAALQGSATLLQESKTEAAAH